MESKESTESKELGSTPGANDRNFPHSKQPEGSHWCYAACIEMLTNYYHPTYMGEHDEEMSKIAKWYCDDEDRNSEPENEKMCVDRSQDLGDPNWLKKKGIVDLGPPGIGTNVVGKENNDSFLAQQTLLSTIKTEIDSEHPVILRLAPNDDAHFVCVYGYKKKGNNWRLMVSDPAKPGITLTIPYVCKKSIQNLKNTFRVTVTSPGNADTEDERAIIGFYTTSKMKKGGRRKSRKKRKTRKRRKRKSRRKRKTRRKRKSRRKRK
jgi:hypothetical protein